MTEHSQCTSRVEHSQHCSDLQFQTQLPQLNKKYSACRNQRPKKPSAFKCNSSHSSKQKHVAFNHGPDEIISSQSLASRFEKRRNSVGTPSASGQSITHLPSRKSQSMQNSRVLINLVNLNLDYVTISERIAVLKQIHLGLKEFIHKQQKSFAGQLTKLSKEFSKKVAALDLQAKGMGASDVFKDRLLQVQSALKDKSLENKQLLSEIEVLKAGTRINNKKPEETVLDRPCGNCKLLQIKLAAVREDAIKNNKNVDSLMSENEQLQQQIFDLQQQRAGLDISIEKRVKEALQKLPALVQPKPQSQQLIHTLNTTIQKLEARCKRYEQLSIEESHLRQKQQELQHSSKQIAIKHDALEDAILRSEQQNQKNYQKEHQLLLREEQFFKKIQALKQREQELSKWEKELTEKSIRSIKHMPAFQPSSLSMSESPSKVPEPEISLGILGRDGEDYYNDYRLSLPAEVPRLNLDSKQPNSNTATARVDYSKPRKQELESHPQGKVVSHVSYLRQKYPAQGSQKGRWEPKPKLHGLRPSESNHNLRQPVATWAKHKYESRLVSPHSRHNSPTSTFTGSRLYQPKRNNIQQMQNFNGLENKLDRLRDELKKELESIK